MNFSKIFLVAYIFPALDLLRLALLLPKVNEDICASKDSIRLIDTLLICATDNSSVPNQMLALRSLCNLFSHSIGESLAVTHSNTILKAVDACGKSQNKNVQVALSTLYLNYAIHLNSDKNSDQALKFECLTHIASLLTKNLDPEAQYRLMVALGTLIATNAELRQMTKSEDLFKVVNNLVSCTNPAKVGNCAEQLSSLLK